MKSIISLISVMLLCSCISIPADKTDMTINLTLPEVTGSCPVAPTVTCTAVDQRVMATPITSPTLPVKPMPLDITVNMSNDDKLEEYSRYSLDMSRYALETVTVYEMHIEAYNTSMAGYNE